MKKRVGLLVVVAVVVAAGIFGYRHWSAADAAADGRLRVSGVIEIVDAEVAFEIPGRVRERKVDEGDAVVAGDLVASLVTDDLEAEVAVRAAEVAAAEAALAELREGSRPEEIRAAEAEVAGARAVLDELRAGSRPEEIAAAVARVESAKAEEAWRRTSLSRTKELLAKSVVTAEEDDRARQAHEAAAAKLREAKAAEDLVRAGPREEEVRRAEAALAGAEARHALVVAGPRSEAIAAAKSRLDAARAALAAARTRLSHAVLVSPLDGVVLTKSVEPGEVVSPGTPVVTVGGLDSVFLRAWIPEARLGRVKLGQAVKVTTDTWPDREYEGRITFLSDRAEFTPRSVQTPEERVKLVYRVKISIPNPDHTLKPGMPADGEILAGGDR